MDLSVVVRGQSNAFLLVSDDQGNAGSRALIAEVQRLLGFDGVNDRVLLDDWWQPGESTIFGATSFIGDWMAREANGAWQPQQYEQALLRNVSHNPPATETAIVWLHNESDSVYYPELTVAEWEGAVRADAALVRNALGLDAARSPYVFVSAIPFPNADDDALQIIRATMENLEADPGFNADVGARALDVDMTYRFPFETDITDRTYGLSHISARDAATIDQRLARSLAEEWAEYAKPGSPIALAGGDIASDGPKVVAATAVDADTLVVRVAHDRASGFAPLDADAAAGVGWAASGPSGPVFASNVQVLSADALQIDFRGAVPTGGLLYYGYGYGRLAATDQPGQGNAIYDDAGLPLWAPAIGVPISRPAPAAPVSADASPIA